MAHYVVPRGTIPLVGAIVGFSLVVVTTAVLMDDSAPPPVVPENATMVSELTFADAADGGIIVRSDDGELVLPSEYNGFVRGVLRALARERRKVGVGPEEPFVLAREASGSFYIGDPSTGERIDLRAFGRDNALAFVTLLPGANASMAPTSRE
jgi:putative photosynthetic complex assembly protein